MVNKINAVIAKLTNTFLYIVGGKTRALEINIKFNNLR